MVKSDVRFYSLPITTKRSFYGLSVNQYQCLVFVQKSYAIEYLLDSSKENLKKIKSQKYILHKRTRKCSIIREFSTSIINPEWLILNSNVFQLWLKNRIRICFLSNKVHEIHFVYSTMIYVPILAFNKGYMYFHQNRVVS